MAEKLAVIKTGGKQYKVRAGQEIEIEKLDAKEGEKVKFETLLLSNHDGSDLELGTPNLGERVEAKVKEHGKAEKKMVVKFKNKTRYLRRRGHRQLYTKVQIEKVA
jgi:large subunit ribosomal protein L21